MKNYHIYIATNEHYWTPNCYANNRTNYTEITVIGKSALIATVAELRNNGEHISEICTDLGTRIYI